MAAANAQISMDQVAEFLLRNQYLLTSLELYQESVEKGQELLRLKNLFTPAKLDELIANEDPNSWGLASSVMRPPRGGAPKSASASMSSTELMNKIALLEYELRQERQTSQSLRSELANLLISKDHVLPSNNADTSAFKKMRPPSSIETRILNFITKQYLISQGYKLAAISLSSESGQDLDHWSSCSSDFGVDRPQPPQLTALYRYFYGAINNQDDTKAVYAAIEQYASILSKTKQELDELRRENASLKADKESTSKSHRNQNMGGNNVSNNLPGTNVDSQLAAATPQVNAIPPQAPIPSPSPDANKALEAQRQAQASADLAAAKEQVKKKIPKRTRDYTFLFTRDESEMDDGSRRIASEVIKMKDKTGDNQCVATIVGDALPQLITGVILKKREELIPLIVSGIYWLQDEKKRSELTYMLFNLIKVPNSQQRKIIVDGCMSLASLIGEERIGKELLPFVAEVITSNNEERRILGAETCGWLAPNVQHEMRTSLLMSMLTVLANDRSAHVRSAVAVNLARLLVLEDKDKGAIYHGQQPNAPPVSTSSEHPDAAAATNGTDIAASNISAPTPFTIDPMKFQQLCDVVLGFLQDPNADVLQVTRTTLLPVFGEFIDRLQLLESKYLPSVLSKMSKILVDSNGNPTPKASAEWDLSAELLVHLAPTLYENCLLQMDFYEEVTKAFRGPKHVTGSKYSRTVSAFTEDEKRVLSDRFSSHLETISLPSSPVQPNSNWTILDWMLYNFVPSMALMAQNVDVQNEVVLNALCNTLSTFTQEFGESFTRKCVQPKFVDAIASFSAPTIREQQRGRLIVVYIVSVITGLDEKDVGSNVKQYLVDLALKRNGWSESQFNIFRISLRLLLDQFEDHKETILSTLADMINHEEAEVRKMVLQVYSSLLDVLSATDLTGRVLPSLLTMSNDVDLTVRGSVIAALGELAVIMPNDTSAIKRIQDQLDSFISKDPREKPVMQLIKTYGKIFKNVSPDFREPFVLKQYLKIVSYIPTSNNIQYHSQASLALFDAIRNLSGVPIGRDSIRDLVLPCLKALQKLDSLPEDKKPILTNVISAMETQVSGKRTSVDGRLSNPSPTAANSSSGNSAGPPNPHTASAPPTSNSATTGANTSTSTFSSFFGKWGS